METCENFANEIRRRIVTSIVHPEGTWLKFLHADVSTRSQPLWRASRLSARYLSRRHLERILPISRLTLVGRYFVCTPIKSFPDNVHTAYRVAAKHSLHIKVSKREVSNFNWWNVCKFVIKFGWRNDAYELISTSKFRILLMYREFELIDSNLRSTATIWSTLEFQKKYFNFSSR